MLTTNRIKSLGITLVMVSCWIQTECLAQTNASNLFFEVSAPANAGSAQVLGPEDNPYLSQVTAALTVDFHNFRESIAPAAAVNYRMESGTFIDNSGQNRTNFGMKPTTGSKMQNFKFANTSKWQGGGLVPWASENETLFKNNADMMFILDYETDAKAFESAPLISSSANLVGATNGIVIPTR